MTVVEPWGPGHVIAGKFKLIEQLGRGGMGSVWAADHLALNSRVAVKIIDPAIANSTEALDRFLREAQSAAALRSPHVVQTFDYGVDGGVPFIAMELLEGRTLAQRIEQDGPIPIDIAAVIMTQVCRAISRAHDAGIIHRDLKPDNIFLVTNDDEEIAKVLDFGIAKATGSVLGSSSQTRTGAVLGTPYYMSPEQAEGNRSVDHRTDLWSLAVIAFECVTGVRPFESAALGDLILQICVRPIRKPSSVLPVPELFDEFFAKGTQRDVSKRFQSSRELATAIRLAAGLRASSGETTKLRVPGEDPTGAPRALMDSQLGRTPQGSINTPQGLRTNLEHATGVTAKGLGTPQPPLNATTGGMGAVAHTQRSSRPPTAIIIGATVAAIVLALGVAFIALRNKEPADAHLAGTPPTPSATATEAKAAEPPPPSEPAKVAPAEPAKVAEPTAAAPTPSAEQPVVAPVPAEPTSAPAKPGDKRVVARPAPAKPGPAKPAPAGTPRTRVDFGF
jgi:serine/threonine-protein kinase